MRTQNSARFCLLFFSVWEGLIKEFSNNIGPNTNELSIYIGSYPLQDFKAVTSNRLHRGKGAFFIPDRKNICTAF